MPFLLAALFLVSGAAALVYEVAWVRMLAGALGASSYTIGTVLAAFMAGLALGARWIGRSADASRNPLFVYAKLESLIALAAVLVPVAFLALPALSRLAYPALENHLWLLTAFRCLLAFAVLIVPTALMGATFPAMAAAVAARGHRGWRVGLVYGANTLGAVGGVMAAGFWLIGSVGLRQTTWIAAGANLLVAGAAWAIARSMPGPTKTVATEPDELNPELEATGTEQRLALFAAASAGFVSLGFEVLWTRMFSALFASVTYSFTLMLGIFLLGLALSAPLAGRLSDWIRARLELTGVIQVLVAIAALGTFLMFPRLSTTTGTTTLAFGGPNWGKYLASLAGDALTIMLLPAFLMGAVFPVVSRILAQGPRAGLASRLGRVFAASTVGSMAGSLLTGFVLIPLFGNFSAVSLFLAFASATCGIVVIFQGSSWKPRDRWTAGVAAAAILAVFASQKSFYRPVLLEKTVLARPENAVLFHKEGPSLSVTVVEDRNTHDRTMWTDAFRVAGTGATYEYMRMLAHLPMLLGPGAKTACVVGLGTGTTAGTLAVWPLERLDIVELCPEVAEGAKWFSGPNRGLMDRIGTDPRLRIYFDDGKAYLRSTRRSYDVIVAEPLNPHMTGASALYSRDFYEAARDRLSGNGIVTQWIPIHGVKSEDFRALFRTFYSVFPETAIWYFKEAIVLTGHKEKFGIDYRSLKDAMEREGVKEDLESLRLADIYTLLGSFVCGPRTLVNYARYAEIITDDLPTIEYFRKGVPVAFAEKENLDGITRHREPVLPYVRLEARTEEEKKGLAAQRKYFEIVATNHYMARGEYIRSRLLEMEAEQARQAGAMSDAQRLYASAKDKLSVASEMAPGDEYVKASLERYMPKTGAMPELGSASKEWVLKSLQGGSVSEKVMALKTLARWADHDSLAIVYNGTLDRDETVRAEAVRTMGEIASAPLTEDKYVEWTAEKLDSVLTRGREAEEVHLAVVESLGKLGTWGATKLSRCFEGPGRAGHENANVRVAAVMSLAKIGTPDALGYTMLGIRDQSAEVRGRAMTALANARDPGCVPALIEGLIDENGGIRSVAVEGLKMITGLDPGWKDHGTPEEKMACRKAWEGWWDEFIRARDLTDKYMRMPREELEAEINVRLFDWTDRERELFKNARALWNELAARRAAGTPVTLAAFDQSGFPDLLKRVQSSGGLWLALVIAEKRAALACRAPLPVRQKQP